MVNILSTYTILVIEDNEDINLLTQAVLQSKGYNVLTAFNGTEGLEIARNNSIDLIILDVMMPDMNGYEVLAELKKNETTENTMVVFLSAKTLSEEVDRGLKLGAIKYFEKPYDPVEFLEEIGELLKKAKTYQ